MGGEEGGGVKICSSLNEYVRLKRSSIKLKTVLAKEIFPELRNINCKEIQ